MFDHQEILELKKMLGDQAVSAGRSVLEIHSHDESFHPPVLPDVVVSPRTTEDVSAVLTWAYERGVPVTPWGAGTSLEGNPIPVAGGIVVDLQEMNRILDIRQEDFQADVEAGVVYKDLNKKLGRMGLFFPPDPGAAATVGGMIANNASGIRTVAYGSTRDYVQRLVVVLPDGRVIRTGTRAKKSSSGYSLCSLFAGSEGTLGLITEATLRLEGLPSACMAVRATFSSVPEAAETVFEIMRSGVALSAMEFLDAAVVRMLNRDQGTSLEEEPTLLMEFFGYGERALEEEMGCVEEICYGNGCTFLDRGLGLEERNRLWEIRYQTFESIKRSHPGLKPLIMDVAVPLSVYGEMVVFVKEAFKGLSAYVFGHAGDGNIHVTVMDDPTDPGRWERVQNANERIVRKALQAGGTCTGEHGVGLGKKRFVQEEHGGGLEVMKAIKNALDPKGIMNPGKIFP